MQPRQCTFDHPASGAKSASVVGIAACDQWSNAALTQRFAVTVGVVSTIALDHLRPTTRPTALSTHPRNRIDQRKQLRDVVPIRAGQDHSERNAIRIRDRVVLRAVFTPICGIWADFLPPKMARTELLSTTARDQSIWLSAWRFDKSVACNRSHTPAFCQSRKRRQQVMPQPQPSSCGKSSQPMPVLSTNRMPVNAWRSDTAGRPPLGRGWGAGNNGATISQSLSVSSGLAIFRPP